MAIYKDDAVLKACTDIICAALAAAGAANTQLARGDALEKAQLYVIARIQHEMRDLT